VVFVPGKQIMIMMIMMMIRIIAVVIVLVVLPQLQQFRHGQGFGKRIGKTKRTSFEDAFMAFRPGFVHESSYSYYQYCVLYCSRGFVVVVSV
jgi:hypothetical protein